LEASRRALDPKAVAVLGGRVHEHLAAQPFFEAARAVALYAAQPFEVPTGPLFEALRRRGVRCCYPRVLPGQRELEFREVESLGALLPGGRLQLLEPAATAPAVALTEIDLVLVPGVGFTLDGRRLGRGGGFYDATLSRMPGARRVGLAFELSVVPTLPQQPHDVLMHALVTERRFLECRGPGRY
jgi:5-formyltetrahydrofolate cyclo-ligase